MLNYLLYLATLIVAEGEGAAGSIDLGNYISASSFQPLIDAITSVLPVALPIVFSVMGISVGLSFMFKLIRKAK